LTLVTLSVNGLVGEKENVKACCPGVVSCRALLARSLEGMESMRPIGHHVSIRLVDSRVIAPSVSARRALSACVLRVAGPHGLLAHRGSDTHLHLLMLYAALDVLEVLRRVRIGLCRVLDLGAPFASPRVEVVRRQEHLENAFRYVLRQDKHHGFASDPFHEASCAPDLLGLRLVDSHLRPRLAEHLPRVGERTILRYLDLPPLRPGVEPAGLLEGAAAALAVSDLSGRRQEIVLARRAFVQCALPQLTTAEIAALLGCSRRAVQRMARAPVPPALVRAVSLQAGLREHVTRRSALPLEPGWDDDSRPQR